jgi:NAD(P)-binding Rossmann-like domain
MTSLRLFWVSTAIFAVLSQGVQAIDRRGNNSTPYLVGYDYIVVGSGPGGAPLAARLGLAGYKVLVIEAGSDVAPSDWNISVPLFNSKASEDPLISWDFYVRSTHS